ASPVVYWHSAAQCDTLEPPRPGNETRPVTISRIATFGSNVRLLLRENQARPVGVCNPFKLRSNIAVDPNFVYFIDTAGHLVRLPRTANTGDFPERVSAAPVVGNDEPNGEIVDAGAHVFVSHGRVPFVHSVNKQTGVVELRGLLNCPCNRLQYDGRFV